MDDDLTHDQLERFAIEVQDITPDAEAHRIWQAKIAAAKVRAKWVVKKKLVKSEDNA